jgi:hypothetical protein
MCSICAQAGDNVTDSSPWRRIKTELRALADRQHRNRVRFGERYCQGEQ